MLLVVSSHFCSRTSGILIFFFCKQKTAYEVRTSDWSSDVCSSDLLSQPRNHDLAAQDHHGGQDHQPLDLAESRHHQQHGGDQKLVRHRVEEAAERRLLARGARDVAVEKIGESGPSERSEERRGGKEGVRTGGSGGGPEH